ncbi:MAG: Pvc16 family protein [Polyangiaceae bacterium]
MGAAVALVGVDAGTSDLIRIWEAVQRPYRLSVSYVVRTARISSQLVQETPLVSQRNITLTQL